MLYLVTRAICDEDTGKFNRAAEEWIAAQRSDEPRPSGELGIRTSGGGYA